jgi:hypothetical protein
MIQIRFTFKLYNDEIEEDAMGGENSWILPGRDQKYVQDPSRKNWGRRSMGNPTLRQ